MGRRRTPEGIFLEKVLKEYGHRDDLLLYRNSSGQAVYEKKNGKKYAVPYGIGNGGADLLFCQSILIKPQHVGEIFGMFGGAELKTPDEDLNPDQVIWGQKVNSAGGKAARVASFDDMDRLLRWKTN